MNDMVLSTRSALVLADEWRAAIIKAETFQEVKTIRDQAQVLADYCKVRGTHFEVQQAAAEAKLRAERKIGEMLAEMPKNGGERGRFSAGGCTPQPPATYADIGIEKTQAHRWQTASELPEQEFESFIESTKEAGRELTSAATLKAAKQWKAQHPEESDTITLPTNDFAGQFVNSLQTLIEAEAKFSTIYADPPWKYGNQGTRASTDNHYGTMTVDEICAEPVAQLVNDEAHLHLWTTNAFLFEAKRVIEAWGFEYKSCFLWVKPQIGIGNYWRVSHEFMLLGVRGGLTFADKSQRSWMELDRTKHSRKPREVREAIEKVSPATYLEMYGREAMPTPWTVYGNQVEASLFHNDGRMVS